MSDNEETILENSKSKKKKSFDLEEMETPKEIKKRKRQVMEESVHEQTTSLKKKKKKKSISKDNA